MGELDRAVHDLFATSHGGDVKRTKPVVNVSVNEKTETMEQVQQTVHYTLDTKTLPLVQGCLRHTGKPHHIFMLVDTGATDNIVNAALLKNLGIRNSDIKKKYVLSSATDIGLQ